MEYRFKKVGEVINGLEVGKYTCVAEFKKIMPVKEVFLLGRMGNMGVKTHAFKCCIVNDNIIIGGTDLCGSSKFMSTDMRDDLNLVTCSKCLKLLSK